MRAITAVLVLAIAIASPAWAESKTDKVRELMRETGMEQLLVQAMTQMMEGMKPMLRAGLKDTPPGFAPLMEEEMTRGFQNASGDYLSMAVALYSDTFSEAEIDEMRAFYRSPTGQKMVAKQPALLQRSMENGGMLGQRIGLQAFERAKARYEASHKAGK